MKLKTRELKKEVGKNPLPVFDNNYFYIKRENKILRSYFYLLVILCLLALSLNVYFLILPNYYKYDYETDITYHGLEPQHVKMIQDILKDVKPKYMKSTKSMKFFVEDYNLTCSDKRKNPDDTIAGCNWKHEIEARTYQNKEYMRILICHELLHNFIIDEELVRDLEDTGVCYD